MTDLIEDLLALLGEYLPENAFVLITQIVAGLIALLLIGFAVWRFMTKNAPTVRPVKIYGGEAGIKGQTIAVNITKSACDIHDAHPPFPDSGQAGELESLGKPQRIYEGIEGSLTSVPTLLAELGAIPFVPVLLNIMSFVWPRPELSAEIFIKGDAIHCKLTVDGVETYIPDPAPMPHEEGLSSEKLTETIAYLFIHAVGSMNDKKTNNFRIGTKSWRAFRAHTKALALWNRHGFVPGKPEIWEQVKAGFEEALAEDPDYAMVYNNLGTLYYTKYNSEDANNQAKAYFLRAIRKARVSKTPSKKTSGKNKKAHKVFAEDRRLKAFAYIGLARCYCMDVHRYAASDEKSAAKAVKAAEKAVALMPENDPHALAALAFAHHCAETMEGIEKAIDDYEAILKKHEGRFITVRNNLGYIYMKGAAQLAHKGESEKAAQWFTRAEKLMREVLSLADREDAIYGFAGANLGELHRVQDDPEDAIRLYKKYALRDQYMTYGYKEGHNELARAYFHNQDIANGMAQHEIALSLTESDTYKHKLASVIAEFLGEYYAEKERDVAALNKALGSPEKFHEKKWLKALKQFFK